MHNMVTHDGQKKALVSNILGSLAYILANHWVNIVRQIISN